MQKTMVPMTFRGGGAQHWSPSTGGELKYDSCEEEFAPLALDGTEECYLKEEHPVGGSSSLLQGELTPLMVIIVNFIFIIIVNLISLCMVIIVYIL